MVVFPFIPKIDQKKKKHVILAAPGSDAPSAG
jgi:hypothetical protein